MKKILLFLIIVIGLGMGMYYFSAQSPSSNSGSISSTFSKVAERVMPTPLPIVEMSIPYLRGKTYQSQLDELTVQSQHPNYTAYLTSYQSEGLKINGLLTQPTGEMPDGGWPAIVFVHGYIPPQQYETTERYVDYVDYLARNGFVVFKIDLRGHAESEGDPSGAYYSSGYIIDTLNAYSALQNANFVNATQIGLWGHSMAGNVVFRAWAVKPNIPAVVIWAGAGYTYQDLQEYGLHDPSYQPRADQPWADRPSQASPSGQQRRQSLRDILGEVTPDNPLWSPIIPTNYLSDISGAIELHHAVNDETVNIEYSRNLNRLLDETDIPHQFYEYPSGGHNISGSNFSLAMQRTVRFFHQYLDHSVRAE